MIVKLVNKLQELDCNFSSTLQEKIDEENYGLKPCNYTSLSFMDKDPKFQQLKKDFIKHYMNYTENQLLSLKNECNVLKIIKKL